MADGRSFNGDILNHAYRHESDADVRERILLVRRVKVDGKYIEDVARDELYIAAEHDGRTSG